MPWHQKLARDAGLPDQDVAALRTGSALSDEGWEALRVFTRHVVRERGKVSQSMLNAFFAEGWSARQVLEIILGVAIKTMSNYTNAIARVPLDDVVKREA